ncbi:MAG: efflux RND transporter periplasmic adaptor subunit [Isosphaeraceae bacterium]
MIRPRRSGVWERVRAGFRACSPWRLVQRLPGFSLVERRLAENPNVQRAREWFQSNVGPITWARLAALIRGLPRMTWDVILANSWLSLTLVVSAATILAMGIVIIMPGYTSPLSRLYTSKFGYGSLLRKLRKPFPVTATYPRRRTLSRTCLGEGLVRSEPLVVSIVPMGTILKSHVREGDFVRKGQLLAEIDSTKADIKADAARAALATAKAELERVRIGSAYVLEKERPERDQIRLQAVQRAADLQRQMIRINQRLAAKGYASREEQLKQEIDLVKLEAEIKEALFNLRMSEKGVSQSLVVAESAVAEAELALRHRLHELKEYKVYAIADGRIERCLVHEGEYNQDPGKPGFLIAAGSWFEANFDQGAFRRVNVEDRAEVRLEAYPERVLPGTVTWVNPFVTYELGGPESTRPIRPMGTGAPEWPATFAVRIQIENAPEARPIPGMTGFAIIVAKSEVLTLPREAVSAITGGKGIVFLVDGDDFVPQEVTLGLIDGDYIEVRDGLTERDQVLRDGHQVLEKGDKIRIQADPDEAIVEDDSGPRKGPRLTGTATPAPVRAGPDAKENDHALPGGQGTGGPGRIAPDRRGAQALDVGARRLPDAGGRNPDLHVAGTPISDPISRDLRLLRHRDGIRPRLASSDE